MLHVAEYNLAWPQQFTELHDRLWRSLNKVALAIEHVGSTSVPALAAKPTIDIDVVIRARTDLQAAVVLLAGLGYSHRGDLGIDDREAFGAPAGEPRHHLYVCSSSSLALRNHLTVRDHLRTHPADVAAYAALKTQLAATCTEIDEYTRMKTAFLLEILAKYGFSSNELEAIRRNNEG